MRHLFIGLALLAATELALRGAAACPFCGAPEPTLSQRRESAEVVVLAEAAAGAPSGQAFRVHQAVKGAGLAGKDELLNLSGAAGPDVQPGTLVLLMAMAAGEDGELAWEYRPLNEVSYAYVARLPGLRQRTGKRLAFFAPYLEHAEGLIAEDAWLEFAHAPYDEVARVADHLSAEKLRDWLVDASIPQKRKGFYAMALGLAGAGRQRSKNAAFLLELIREPASDFRAGFDGLLAGYLLLSGSEALAYIERRYLDDPSAAQGDVRHAVSALRFYHDAAGEMPPQRIERAMRKALARREVAPEAVADLARWRDWGALDAVVKLFDKADYPQPATDRAIVGYLTACPGDEAARALDGLKKRDPRRVSRAQEAVSILSGSVDR